jgi:mRNA interferase HicA
MKRKELLRHLESHGCRVLREGRKHTVIYDPETRRTSTLPRHREIDDWLAFKICRDLGVPGPQTRG